MTQLFELEGFLSRSTDRPFGETTLKKVLDGLPRLDGDGVWLAGGALRRTLLGQEPDSDFDFFFRDAGCRDAFEYGLKDREFSQIRKTEHHRHYRGKVEGGDLPVNVQVIDFAFFESAVDVIEAFDFTICQFAFDGEALTCGDFALWDLGRKRLAVNKITFPVSSMRRLIKYTAQGFRACNGALATILRLTAEMPNPPFEIAYVD